jgi:hypothetical protein
MLSLRDYASMGARQVMNSRDYEFSLPLFHFCFVPAVNPRSPGNPKSVNRPFIALAVATLPKCRASHERFAGSNFPSSDPSW